MIQVDFPKNALELLNSSYRSELPGSVELPWEPIGQLAKLVTIVSSAFLPSFLQELGPLV